MASGGGNLKIFIDDEEHDRDHSGNREVKELKKYTFEGLEAFLVDNFCPEEIKQLAVDYDCLIHKEPKVGQTKEFTIKQAQEKYTDSVEKTIDKVRQKLGDIQKQEIEYKINEELQVEDFIQETVDDKSTVKLYLDKRKRKVFIVGLRYEDIDKALHSLKISLGRIKPNYRATRQLSLDDTSKQSNEKDGGHKSSANYHRQFSSHDGGEKFSFEVRFGSFVFKVYKASITNLDVDVIVNAANDNLMHGGGVARVISRAAGYELDLESKEYIDRRGLIPVTKNCLTTAGHLHYEKVIHAVGPQWHDYSYKDKVRCMDDVYDTVFNVLLTCEKKRFKSVGIPAISAGIYGVPKPLCADMYVKAAVDFSKMDKSCPTEMHFIDVDMEILKLVQASVYKYKENPDSINQRHTVPAFLKSNRHHGSHSSHGQGHISGQGQRQGHSNRRNRSFGHQTSYEDGVDMDEATYSVKVEDFQRETFRWGGEAHVFLVGGAITVKIFKGEINKVRNLDALVCGIDTNLTARGPLADALANAGGYVYKNAVDDLRKFNKNTGGDINDVFLTGPGNLGVKYVLHLVNKRIATASEDELSKYKEGVSEVLTRAKRRNFKSLALPLIGTGSIQGNAVKLKKCCSALLHAVCDFCSKEKSPSVTDIHLINNSQSVCDAIISVFKLGCDGTVKSTGRAKTKDANYTHERLWPSSSSGRENNGSSEDDTSNKDVKYRNGKDVGGRSKKKRTYTSQGRIDYSDDDDDDIDDREKSPSNDDTYEAMEVDPVMESYTGKQDKAKPAKGNIKIFDD